jgi:hypothetical protein
LGSNASFCFSLFACSSVLDFSFFFQFCFSIFFSPQPAIAGSAAGALQNVSREVASRLIIRDSGAVLALADLLVEGKELQTQVRTMKPGRLLILITKKFQLKHSGYNLLALADLLVEGKELQSQVWTIKPGGSL